MPSQRLLRARQDAGFTLVELLVVILIIGILAAIAIPSFINQQDKGHDTEAKSQAATAAKALEACRVDSNGSYASCTVGELRSIEPTLNSAGSRLTVTSGTNDFEVVVTASRDARRRLVHALPRRGRHDYPLVLHGHGRQGRLLRAVRRQLVAPAPALGDARA